MNQKAMKKTSTGTGTSTIKIRSYDQYIVCLQEERRKIHVFRRELPLCLQLVDQAIEDYKRRVCTSRDDDEDPEEEGKHEEEGGDKSWNDGPVLEQFIPLKQPAAQDRQEDEQHTNNKSDDKTETKTDWLKSAQLWNQKSSLPYHQDNGSPRTKENCSRYLPFLKINTLPTPTLPAADDTGVTGWTPPTHIPTTSTSSTADNSRKTKQDKEGDSRKARRCWSQELHRNFLQALQQLGGCHAATPKQIRELMKVDGLTSDEVKSHLQKYRLHTRRPSRSPVHKTGDSQTSQYVVVSGMWGAPRNYTAKGDETSRGPNKIYVPVASPPILTACQLQHQQQLQLSVASPRSKQESDRAEHSLRDHNAHSGSPAAASSTETTTASPHF